MNTYLNNLAIFSGTPAFKTKLHVGRPNIGNQTRLLERIEDALDRRWLTNNGPYVQELESNLSELIGAKHIIVMNNATIALEIVIRALGLNGEVIVPSFTFVATAHALQWQGITPVFCDVDPDTHNLDPSKLESLITPRTTGIVGVHVWGRPCDIEDLTEISQRRGLQLIFDAAHALGCSYRGKMIGNFGSAEVFSFHATKFFNSFEGGAVATNDDDLANKIRLMKNFGFSGPDKVTYIGTNGKMNEISAAMGLTSLESLNTFIETNRINYTMYCQQLSAVSGIKVIQYDQTEKNNFHYIVIEVDAIVAGLTRDQLVEVLWHENVLARRYFYPGVHMMEPYRSHFPHASLLLPKTEYLTQQVMSLPNGTAVTPDDVKKICGIIQQSVEHSSEISRKLKSLS